MSNKNEDAPTNATGPSVAGTGDTAEAWKKKKKKKKQMEMLRRIMADGKNMDQLHDLIKQGKSAKEIAKIMGVDPKTIQSLMEDGVASAPVDTPVITPDLTFATMPVFKVGSDDFAKCKFGKSKFSRWAKHIDVTSESGKRIYAYAKKHPNKSIIVQHEKSGHMLYLRKYSKADGGKSGIMVKKKEK